MGMMKKEWRRLLVYYLYLFSAWSLFRYFVRLPEVIEELWFKPVIWLTPLFWWRLSQPLKWNIFEKNDRWVFLLGAGVGGILFLMVKAVTGEWTLKGGFDGVGISLTTAVVEELTFAGILLTVVGTLVKKELWAAGFTALLFALIHLPVGYLVYNLGLVQLGGVILINLFLSYVANLVRLRTKNVLGAVLIHWGFLLALI